jgi:hypothetical protein
LTKNPLGLPADRNPFSANKVRKCRSTPGPPWRDLALRTDPDRPEDRSTGASRARGGHTFDPFVFGAQIVCRTSAAPLPAGRRPVPLDVTVAVVDSDSTWLFSDQTMSAT